MTSKPLCLLALDGGGIRGLSELVIIEEIMTRIKSDLDMDDDPIPADFFDLVGGTSTGGLIALLLGRLRLSVPQARRKFVEISKKVFSIERFLRKFKFDGKALEDAVRKTLQDSLGPGHGEERMLDPVKTSCKAFVCAVPQVDIRARAGPTLFRSYKVREHPTYNCTIWEASRATSAAPTYFDPISIGDPGEEEVFVDGALGYNNPIEQVLEEANRIFPRRKVACIVSIGTGLARAIHFPGSPKTSPVKLVEALAKMATESDRVAERVQAQFQATKDTYFRFSVDRGLDNIHMDEWENLPNVRTYTNGYLRQSSVSSQIDAVVKALLASKAKMESDGSTAMVSVSAPMLGEAGSMQSRPQVLLLPWRPKEALLTFHYTTEDIVFSISPRHDRASTRVWSVPFPKNESFTGRESDLRKLRAMLFIDGQTRIAAITGLGGIGKTQLALALVHETKAQRADYSIIWIPAASMESVEKAYLNAAQQLGIATAKKAHGDIKALVRDHLSKESTGRWLLVFDNADDIRMWTDQPSGESGGLKQYLPESRYGSVIFTTRVHDVALALAHRNIVRICELDEADSKQLLRSCLLEENHCLLDNEKDTAKLLAELVYLPLAIAQAAAFINRNRVSLRDYLARLGEHEEAVIKLLSAGFGDERRHPAAKDPVATTWLISFEQIHKHHHLAATYLSWMACVDAKDIPLSLLPPGSSRVEQDDALGTLQGYSFIAKRTSDSSINIHRLVHLATRNWLRRETLLSEYTREVVSKLAALLVDVRSDNSDTWRAYMPHSYYTLGTIADGDDHDCLSSLLTRYGKCLLYHGRYSEAEMHIGRAVHISKAKLGADHPDTLASVDTLALTFQKQGRWQEAEGLQVQTLRRRKAVLGADDPDTLSSMHQLSLTYYGQGRWKEAEELQLQTLKSREAVFGVDCSDTLASMNSLALIHHKQGRLEEAERLYVQALSRCKAILSADHPNTLACMHNLAYTLRRQGRRTEAVAMVKECASVSLRVLGPNHSQTHKSIAALKAWA